MKFRRPEDREVPEFFSGYIQLIDHSDILQVLEEQLNETPKFFQQIDAPKWNYSYASGKWTLKEAILHLIDTERIMAYRALRIARGDQTPLPGFDHNKYIAHYKAAGRAVDSVIEEYEMTRRSTLALLRNIDEEAFDRMGTASGYPISVLALAYMIAGHEKHHLNIINARYLPPTG